MSDEPQLHDPICLNCQCWQVDWKSTELHWSAQEGHCHRYAPRQLRPSGFGQWPRTCSIDRCGEFLPKTLREQQRASLEQWREQMDEKINREQS